MISRLGVIFAGRVLSVEYFRPRFSDEVPSITFRVERGIRGTRTGNRFVLRESSLVMSVLCTLFEQFAFECTRSAGILAYFRLIQPSL